jgi:arsenate reductase
MVLFVCVENTFRSVLSEAIFNAHAPKGWHAESAGVQPAEAINPIAIELLSEVGIGLDLKKPRLVSPESVARAWRVITFGCVDRCPIGAKKSEDWPIPGSTGKSAQELRAIRDELQRRILRLIGKIEQRTQDYPTR